MWPPQGSCIKASPLMQPVAASPKGDLNTGVLLYWVKNCKVNMMIVVCILNHVFLRCIMETSCSIYTPPDRDRVYMRYKVVNTSGSIMEQRTASKQVGNMPTALISCRIFIACTCEADFLPDAYFNYRNLLLAFMFEKYLLYLLLFGRSELEELKGKV